MTIRLPRATNRMSLLLFVLLVAPVWAAHPPAVAGTGGAVATAAPAATRAGIEILRAGGNAVDAAVASALALAVVHPNAGNLGGGGFAVVRLDGAVHTFDFRETGPAGATPRDVSRRKRPSSCRTLPDRAAGGRRAGHSGRSVRAPPAARDPALAGRRSPFGRACPRRLRRHRTTRWEDHREPRSSRSFSRNGCNLAAGWIAAGCGFANAHPGAGAHTCRHTPTAGPRPSPPVP